MTDQTKLLTDNIHLIRLAVDKYIQMYEFGGNTEMKEFQHQLEKQKITGDSP